MSDGPEDQKPTTQPEATSIAVVAPAAAAPPVQVPRAAPPASTLEALRSAASLDWPSIDIDLPPLGWIGSVGCEVQSSGALVKCDCGAVVAIELDGASRARCPTCKATFRHVLLVQREDQTPSTFCELVDQLLRDNGLKG